MELFELGFKKGNISHLEPRERVVIGGNTYSLDTNIKVMFNRSPLSCFKCNNNYFTKSPVPSKQCSVSSENGDDTIRLPDVEGIHGIEGQLDDL